VPAPQFDFWGGGERFRDGVAQGYLATVLQQNNQWLGSAMGLTILLVVSLVIGIVAALGHARRRSLDQDPGEAPDSHTLRRGGVIRAATVITVAFLVAPTLVVAGASLTNGSQIAFPPEGLTLRWYAALLSDPEVWRTLQNSLYVGSVAVLLASLAAIPAALALTSGRVRGPAVLSALLSLGLATPYIISAVAFLLVFTELRVIDHLTTLGLALAVGAFPIMLWAVASAAANHAGALERAAATLGADRVQQFIFVTFPRLFPGVLTGALLVFVLSITEFVVSVVLVTHDNQTLPVFVYSGIRVTTSPFLAAVAVFQLALALTLFAILLRIGPVERFTFRR
jgi:putative spermidine/putrescine transport system permease protein